MLAFILYNLVVFLFGGPDVLDKNLFELTMLSGGVWKFNWGHLIILLTLFFLIGPASSVIATAIYAVPLVSAPLWPVFGGCRVARFSFGAAGTAESRHFLAGAARETDEEAGAQFEIQGLFSVMNVVRVGQLHLFYRARLLSTKFNPGHETMEARLFAEEDIPWDEIAFRTVKETLQHYFADAKAQQFKLHQIDIV